MFRRPWPRLQNSHFTAVRKRIGASPWRVDLRKQLASIYIKIEEIKHLVLQELQLNLFTVSTVHETQNEDDEDEEEGELPKSHKKMIDQQILEEEDEDDEDDEKTIFNKSENTFTTMNNNSSYYNEQVKSGQLTLKEGIA